MAELFAGDYEPFARAALPHYGLEGATVRLLSYSENATYLVETGTALQAGTAGQTGAALQTAQQVVVLRIHRPGYHSLAAVESELDWMQGIARDTAIVTPAVITALDGRRVVAVHVHDQVLLADIFTFIPGTIAEDSAAQISFSDLGQINALLHEHVHAWTPPAGFTRFRWDLDATLVSERRWGNWRDAPGLTTAQAELIEPAERKVIARLTSYGTGPDRFGLVHADLRMSNLIVDEGRITVIDFDDCGWGWFMTDLSGVVSWIEHTPRASAIVEEWLEGYQRVRRIAETDLAEIPTFIMLRRLMLTAWIGTHPESEPARLLGASYAAGTAELAHRYVTDPSWFRFSAN